MTTYTTSPLPLGRVLGAYVEEAKFEMLGALPEGVFVRTAVGAPEPPAPPGQSSPS